MSHDDLIEIIRHQDDVITALAEHVEHADDATASRARVDWRTCSRSCKPIARRSGYRRTTCEPSSKGPGGSFPPGRSTVISFVLKILRYRAPDAAIAARRSDESFRPLSDLRPFPCI